MPQCDPIQCQGDKCPDSKSPFSTTFPCTFANNVMETVKRKCIEQHKNLQIQCFAEKNTIHLPTKIYGIISSIAVPIGNLYLQFLTIIMRRNGDNKSQKYTLNILYYLLDIYSTINAINYVFSVNFLILHLKPRTCNQLILCRIIIIHR